MSTPRVKYKRRNLVFLAPVSNNHNFISLQKRTPEGVEINTRKGTWTFKGWTNDIGKHQTFWWSGGRPIGIGVYDRTNFRHLQAIVQFVIDSERKPSADD